MEKDPITYEIGYLLKPSLKEEELLAFSEKLRNLITGKTGLILSEGTTKNQPLAYAVKKETNAYFNWIKFLLRPEFIKEIEESLKKDLPVLRFLAMKMPEKTGKAFAPKKIKKIKISQKPKETAEETTPVEKTPIATPEQSVKEEEIDRKIEELLGGGEL